MDRVPPSPSYNVAVNELSIAVPPFKVGSPFPIGDSPSTGNKLGLHTDPDTHPNPAYFSRLGQAYQQTQSRQTNR
jgi:hypothetical protein